MTSFKQCLILLIVAFFLTGCTLLFESEEELKDSKLVGKSIVLGIPVVSIKNENSRVNIENKTGYRLIKIALYTSIYMDETEFINYFPSTTEFKIVSIYQINTLNTTRYTYFLAILEDDNKRKYIYNMMSSDTMDDEPLYMYEYPPVALLDRLYLSQKKVEIVLRMNDKSNKRYVLSVFDKCGVRARNRNIDMSYNVSVDFKTFTCLYEKLWDDFKYEDTFPVVYQEINSSL